MKLIHLQNDVNISKVTHAARPYAAQTARSYGATVSSTKALGGWNDSGSFRNCYDWHFPVDALLGAAMFNGRKPEEYLVSRDALGRLSFLSFHFFFLSVDGGDLNSFSQQSCPRSSQHWCSPGLKRSRLPFLPVLGTTRSPMIWP